MPIILLWLSNLPQILSASYGSFIRMHLKIYFKPCLIRIRIRSNRFLIWLKLWTLLSNLLGLILCFSSPRKFIRIGMCIFRSWLLFSDSATSIIDSELNCSNSTFYFYSKGVFVICFQVMNPQLTICWLGPTIEININWLRKNCLINPRFTQER